MDRCEQSQLMRIFLGESDRHGGRPLYEEIVRKAHELRLAGATVLHGRMGFGRGAHMHTARLLRLSEDLPVVVEIVDTLERLQALLDSIDELGVEVLVTIEQVRCLRSRGAGGSAAD
jgi:hypothetical protein